MKDFFICLLKIAAAAALLAVSILCLSAGSLAYFISVPLLAIPTAVSTMYAVTLSKKEKLIRYGGGARLFFLKSRTVPYLVAWLASFFAAFAVPVRLYTFSRIEIAALLPLPFVFLLSKHAAGKLASYVYKENYAEYMGTRLARFAAAFLMAAAFPLTVYAAGGYGIPEAFPKADFTNNPLARAIAAAFYTWDGIARAVFSAAEGGPLPAYSFLLIPVLFFGSGIIFYFLINFFAFFLMKKNEMLSGFLPVDGSPARPADKFIYAFTGTLGLLFIYPALFAGIQAYLSERQETLDKAEKAAAVSVELINGAAYKLGTWKKIQFEKERFYGRSKEELEKAVNDAYDAMTANVDKYLDWYYSLPAENGRILKLLAGSLESYMEENLKKNLIPDGKGLARTFNDFEKGATELSELIKKILNENKVEYKGGTYSVAIDVNLQDIYENREISGTLNMKKRLALSAGGGLAAAKIAGAAASKMAAKTGFAAASKAAAKAAVQKAASTAAGLAVGAISGIATSPFGGIALGAAAGIAIDKGMLTLEEMIARDDYKKEIIDAINESRKETISLLNEAFEE